MCNRSSRSSIRRTGHRAAVLCAVAALAGAAAASAQGRQSAERGELEQIRAALAKYENPIIAIHDGYFSTLGCVEIPRPGGEGRVPYQPGGMGVHFFNTSLIGPTPDAAKPQVLIYQPVGEKLRLVAAEWFIPLATGVKGRPELFGHPFDGPMEGHHPLMPTELGHWDLHVWLFKPNPAGMFSPTNPSITCGRYPYTVREEAPRLVPAPQP